MVSSRIIGNKNNYLNAPDEILSWLKVDRIYKLGHALPSVVLTILIVLKLFPLLSSDYAHQLEKNATIIPITMIICLIPVIIINGIVIEKILISTNEKYKSFVELGNK
jgi:hypothetical protein